MNNVTSWVCHSCCIFCDHILSMCVQLQNDRKYYWNMTFFNLNMVFCLSIQLLLQFMPIIILHKFWISYEHISNYLKILCVSNIFMKFVVCGIKLIWTEEFFIQKDCLTATKIDYVPVVLLVFSQARCNGQFYNFSLYLHFSNSILS